MTELAKPEIIEEYDYEVILERMMAKAVVLYAAAGVDYDVGNLETDPVKIILEDVAYEEVNLRARANDVARSQIRAFSTGSDLDYLADFYDVTRLTDETDERLRDRVQDAIRGRSPAGSKYWYRYQAMTVDVNIKDVNVSPAEDGPKVYITVLSYDNDGIPSEELLTAVRDHVTSSNIKVTNDVITVSEAVFETVNIEANIYLFDGGTAADMPDLEAALEADWTDRQEIGLDLTTSWIISALQSENVHSVELVSPTESSVASDNKAIAIGNVTLNFLGNKY